MNNTRYLFISLDTLDLNLTNPSITHVFLTICGEDPKDSNKLQVQKEISCFINNYTAKEVHIDHSEELCLTPKRILPTDFQKAVDHYSKESGVVIMQIESKDLKTFLQKALSACNYYISHNATEWTAKILQALNVDLTDKTLIDTSLHIPYKAHITTRKLEYLCAEHNFLLYSSVNERSLLKAHFSNNALITLVNLYSLSTVIAEAIAERCTLIATPPFEQNALIKQLGFIFNPVDKHWELSCTEPKYKEVVATIGMDYLRVKT